MQSEDPCKIQSIQLNSWKCPIEWPAAHTFCIAVVVDASALVGEDCCELVLAGIEAGAGSVFCWGPDAAKAADRISFSIAARRHLGKPAVKTDEEFVAIALNEEALEEALDLMCHAWIENISSLLRPCTLLLLHVGPLDWVPKNPAIEDS